MMKKPQVHIISFTGEIPLLRQLTYNIAIGAANNRDISAERNNCPLRPTLVIISIEVHRLRSCRNIPS